MKPIFTFFGHVIATMDVAMETSWVLVDDTYSQRPKPLQNATLTTAETHHTFHINGFCVSGSYYNKKEPVYFFSLDLEPISTQRIFIW